MTEAFPSALEGDQTLHALAISTTAALQ